MLVSYSNEELTFHQLQSTKVKNVKAIKISSDQVFYMFPIYFNFSSVSTLEININRKHALLLFEDTLKKIM